MGTLNPDKMGELSKFYWQIPAGDQGLDLSQTDAALLSDANWGEFCIRNLSKSATKDMREIMDRCNPTLKTYSPGRGDKSLSFELNQFRWDLTDLKTYHAAIENGDVFSVLALNDDKDETEAWGWIGNYVIEEFGGEEPEDGLNTESYSLKPAARSLSNPAVRWIYGSGIA